MAVRRVFWLGEKFRPAKIDVLAPASLDLPHCGDPTCSCPTNRQMRELTRRLSGVQGNPGGTLNR